MRKKFTPAWQPARLIEGCDRWYIIFYYHNDLSRKRERFRPTFDLNRITDIRLRRKVGEELVQKLNWWMSQGKPLSLFDAQKVQVRISEYSAAEVSPRLLSEAIMELLGVLEKTMSEDTLRTYKNVAIFFLRYLKANKLAKLKCSELDKVHVTGYLDFCLVKRGLAPRTYNNQISHLRTICNKLIARGQLTSNPFDKIPMLRAPKKNRRNFTQEESKAVASYIRQREPLLFYALILEYACFIRPNEIRKLRFGEVDIQTGIVHVLAENAKDHEDRYPTIPAVFLQMLDADFFSRYPPDWYIFGKKFAPHPSEKCGRTTMYNKHLQALKELESRGVLRNIKGLTWYSWKDTGVTDALKYLPVVAVRDQAGHSDVNMTMKYYHKSKVNIAMQGMKNNIL